MVSLWAVSLAAIICGLYYYFTKTFNYWKERNVAGPKPIPLFGNLLKSALRFEPIGIVLKNIYNSYPDDKLVGIYRMTTPSILIRDLDIIKHVTIKDFDNFVDRGVEFSKTGLGTNLFHSDGETWRALRSRFSPIFTTQKLKNMMHLLNNGADKFAEYVTEITIKSPEQNVHALVQKYTIATIAACAFGLDIDTFHGSIDIIDTLNKVDKEILSYNYFFEVDMMFPGLFKKLNMDIFPGFLKKFFKEIVETVITERNGKPSPRKDFMDLIIELKNKEEGLRSAHDKTKSLEITNSLIEAQAFIFYAGGYETSASTMGYMLYQLALDSKIQDRLRNEIKEYLARHDGRIEVDTLNELTYLSQVFDETLRMYPIVDNLQRRAINDYVCSGTNVKIAKDQMVLISVHGIHHDEKYYPEPEKFDPDRFSPENVADRHSCVYLPFGIGPRHCIGMRFAHVQSRVCLIRLLSKFKVEPNKNTLRSFSFDPYRVVLAPHKPLYVNFVPV